MVVIELDPVVLALSDPLDDTVLLSDTVAVVDTELVADEISVEEALELAELVSVLLKVVETVELAELVPDSDTVVDIEELIVLDAVEVWVVDGELTSQPKNEPSPARPIKLFKASWYTLIHAANSDEFKPPCKISKSASPFVSRQPKLKVEPR